jgi:hypothetical protein
MADFVDIVGLNLGTTFGGWYLKNNAMIDRLNALNVASITGGDGIIVSPHTAANGGYTLSIANSVSKDMTFNNVTVTGNLVSNFTGAVSGTTIVLPANTGVTVGNIVYIDSTGKLEKALADDECTAEVVGIVIGFTGGSAQVATTGRISGSSIIEAFTGTVGATLQKGVVYFLSGGVSGAGTTLEPDVTSYVSKPMLLGLTGDSGLILPYRGFIATEGTLGNTTIVQGVCGGAGVLSINGISAAMYASSDTSVNNLKQTGHLYAVSNTSLTGTASPRLTKQISIDLQETSNREIAIFNYGGINFGNFGDTPAARTSVTNVGPFIKKYTNREIKLPNDGFLFSTIGITGDVWLINSIKIIPRKLLTPNIFTFTLQKEYSSYSGTTVAFSGFNPPGNGTANVNIRLELRKNQYAVAGVFGASSFPSYSSLTNTSELITPIIHPIRFTPSASETITEGVTSGILDGTPDSSGTFPIIYTFPQTKTRTSAFTINNVIIGGDESPASRYIKTANENLFYNNVTGSEGYTMESAILGWNAQYGAVSESLYFVPVSVHENLRESDLTNTENKNIICDILLEISKWDTTTRAIVGESKIIHGSYNLQVQSYNISGVVANNTGS